jgi:hypothetical protein
MTEQEIIHIENHMDLSQRIKAMETQMTVLLSEVAGIKVRMLAGSSFLSGLIGVGATLLGAWIQK